MDYRIVLLSILMSCFVQLQAQSQQARGHSATFPSIIDPLDHPEHAVLNQRAAEEFLIRAVSYYNSSNPADTIQPSDSNRYAYDGSNRITEVLGYKYSIDSSKYFLNIRLRYAYNANESTTTFQTWDQGTSLWEDKNRTIVMTDGALKVLSTLSQNWVDSAAAWINTAKNTWLRDQDGRDTVFLSQLWDAGSSAWTNTSKSSTVWSTFFPTGTEGYTDRVSESWDKDSAKWKLVREEQNSFDTKGNLLIAVDFNYFATSVTGLQIQADYNMDDQVTERRERTWDEADQIWQEALQISYTYKSSGDTDIDTATALQWLDIPNYTGWSNLWRKVYNNLGNDTSEVREERGVNNTEWFLKERVLTADDPISGFLVYTISQNWTGSAWENKLQVVYGFDGNDNRTSQKDSRWDFSNFEWELRSQTNLYYTETATGIDPLFLSQLKLYPNPSSRSLTLEFDSDFSGLMNINLLDINGRSIHSFPPAFIGLGSQRIELDLSDVPSGIYFLRMQMGDRSFSRKVIKL